MNNRREYSAYGIRQDLQNIIDVINQTIGDINRDESNKNKAIGSSRIELREALKIAKAAATEQLDIENHSSPRWLQNRINECRNYINNLSNPDGDFGKYAIEQNEIRIANYQAALDKLNQ